MAAPSRLRKLTGRCLCGVVSFEASCDRDHADACHCSQCRRWSGMYWASVNVPYASLNLSKGEGSVGWFRSSETVRRGFCKTCGSALFWHPDKNKEYSHILGVALGAIDPPTGVRITEHIFVKDKGDYYDITDGLPQKEGY